MKQDAEQIKLIFCTDGIFPYAIGGMQRHSRLLIEELAKTKKAEIIVVHPHKEHIFGAIPNIEEIHIKGINAAKNYILESYRYSKRIFPILETYPDYVIYSQGLSVWHKIKKVGFRLIINPHGLEAYQSIGIKDLLKGLPFRAVFNYLFNHCAKVISLGGGLTHILKNRIKDASKIAIIPNGVNMHGDFNLGERSARHSGFLQTLFIGRFAANKGIDILLKATRELNRSGYCDKIIYNLAGTGPLYEFYRRNFKYQNVNYLGFIAENELAGLYKSSDLFILPTLFEGMPTVILEAMSYGLPIIASDVGATDELVDNSNGYLIKKNSVCALKKAIIDFYNLSGEQKKQLSENSYQKVKSRFTWEYIAEIYIRLFSEVKNQI